MDKWDEGNHSLDSEINPDKSANNSEENKMVEIQEDHEGDHWGGESYSDAMKKFTDTCLDKGRKDNKSFSSDEEKENENCYPNFDVEDKEFTKHSGKDHIEESPKDGIVKRKDLDQSVRNKTVKRNTADCTKDKQHESFNSTGNTGDTTDDHTKAKVEHIGSQLTEKNLKMFTKMQYLSHSIDIVKNPKEYTHHKLKYKHFDEGSPSSVCLSPDGSIDEYDESKHNSDFDLASTNSHNPRLMQALLDSKSDMMRFAEVLYKCTLCTSIPSILTSKSSFFKHVRENHLTIDGHFKVCKICSLKFRTEEDLKRHILCIHTESDRLSPMETGSDVIRPEFSNTPENESDSDSSGHRSFKAKITKRSKPHVPDFENPKQLVDHAGIETLNGSLDLSKKDRKSPGNNLDMSISQATVLERGSQRSLNDKSAINVQQITDQIINSNLHGRNMSSQCDRKLPFTPSYTPEFGKYTKLVREGGNIVYFCQVCNWMSPVKAHFHAHCGSLSHSNKVKSTNEQEQGEKTDNVKDSGSLSKSPNISIGAYDMKYGSTPHPGILNVPNTSNFSKLHEANMFYNYIRPRNLTQCGRTPVVSGHGFQERTDLIFGKQFENHGHPLNVPHRKKKRVTSTKIGPSTTQRHSNSDSDSDEMSGDKDNPSRCSLSSVSLLRSKLLQGQSKNNKTSPSSVDNDMEEKNAKPNMSNKSGIAEKSDHKTSDKPPQCASNKRKNCNERGEIDMSDKYRKTEDRENVKKTDEGVHSLFKVYRCMSCPYEYSSLEDYEQHFSKMHMAAGQSEGLSQSSFQRLFTSGSCGGLSQPSSSEAPSIRNPEINAGSSLEMGENWRVQKLKELLPDFLEVNEKGNTSRDYLLQCVSISAGIPDAPLWSSACNKAVREIFPSSLAQRKGKYKKTYYFGLSMMESFQGQEDFSTLDADGQIYQPIRDINADMEKIMEQLPSIIHWNGCMEVGIYRADILSLLADILDEPDVLSWGTQCNRAIKLVFPMVDMKRKGKFKTTKYFGVGFNQNIGKIHGKVDSNSSMATSKLTKEDKHDKSEEHDDSSRETTLVQPDIDNKNSSENQIREPVESENSAKLVPVFPQWFKEEAESQMEQYLTKFGGVFEEKGGKISEKNEDEDNDGDDEGESIEDTSMC